VRRGAGTAGKREAPDVALAGIAAAGEEKRASGGVEFHEAFGDEVGGVDVRMSLPSAARTSTCHEPRLSEVQRNSLAPGSQRGKPPRSSRLTKAGSVSRTSSVVAPVRGIGAGGARFAGRDP